LLSLIAALLVSGSVILVGLRVVHEMAKARKEEMRRRTEQLMNLFATGLSTAAEDPRALLVWQPFAIIARKVFPDEFNALDQASGGRFPFTREYLESAHARWSADWLAWEQRHDSEYKLKAAEAENQITASGAPATLVRARLDAIEREKLELYQRRYSEYVQVSKALQALMK
jgi:hypothetical protein